MPRFYVASWLFTLVCVFSYRLPVFHYRAQLRSMRNVPVIHGQSHCRNDENMHASNQALCTLSMGALPTISSVLSKSDALVSVVGANPTIPTKIGSNIGRTPLGSNRMHTVAPRMDDGLQVLFFYGVTFAIIIALSYAAVMYGNYEKAQEWNRFLKEANRDKELRENMFFEAVDEISKKITNPKLGKKKKAILQSQLKDLDPLGQIQGFLQGNASRPVLVDESEISPTDMAKIGAHSRFGRPKPDTSKKAGEDDNNNHNSGDAVPLSIYNIEEDNETGNAGRIRKLLQTLEDFLEKEECMKPKRRVALITKLSRSFAEVYYNDDKLKKAINAVETHLKDEEYWVRYANKVLK